MAKHLATVVWPTRKVGVYPQVYVQTVDEQRIEISFFPAQGEEGYAWRLSRDDARLLARRLNQCLDETRSG